MFLLPRQLAVLRIILLIWTWRWPMGRWPLGMQYLHMSLINMHDVVESPNTPAKFMNLSEILRID
jgi:hypothetical protein